ncbi:extracellular solute-binding protein [Niallia circulans]
MKYKTFCKRAAFGLMAASLTLSLTACMDNSSSSESVTEDGKTIIKMGRVTAANSKLPEGDTYENNAYTRLVEEKLDAKIVDQFEAEGEDYNRQVALAIASGELPDMMRVDSREELKELVENDLIADLTEVYDKNASDFIKGVYGTYDNKTLEDATFDGKLMAIPGTIGDSAPNIVWIRKDWVEKLGIKLDADGDRQITLDELESTAKAFVDNDPGATGKPVGIPFASWLNAGDYGEAA